MEEGDEDENEEDEDGIQLEDLLDEMMVSEGIEGVKSESGEAVILSSEEAEAIVVGTTVQDLVVDAFDPAAFNFKDMSFK
jgi:hypothetical protein